MNRPSWHLAMLSLALLVIIVLLIQSFQSNSLENQPSLSSVELTHQKRTMVGGYSLIDPKQADELAPISSFALSEFVASEAASTDFFSIVPAQVENNQVTPIVLAAQRQVVAGMNYKLTIGLVRNNICLGGFKVTVWKQLSGELKATQWGDILKCDEIEEEFGEVLNAIKVQGVMEGVKEDAKPNE